MNELKHYGVKRRSGRYPWGSGEDPEQRGKSLLGQVEEMKKKGMTEVQIAEGLGMTTSQLRIKKSLAKTEQRKADAAMAERLKAKGYSNVAIGQRMGIPESTVRNLLDPAKQERNTITNNTADVLRNAVESKRYIDIGVGTERYLGVSRTKLKTAIGLLEEEGYKVSYVQVDQVGTGKKTSIMTLTKDDVTYSELMKNKDKIQMVTDQYSADGGRSFLGLKPIEHVDSKRIMIRYAEDGGSDKDGVIELRRNVKDLDMGNSRYAQVRIGVDGSHYLKGMAMYTDDIPKGVDIIYNTNKSSGTAKEKVFKELKRLPDGSVDPDNPFGATIKAMGQRRALNIINEEGDWDKWSKTLSSQVLSKQTPALAEKLLKIAHDEKRREYEEILSLTNPLVKKKLLEDFAGDTDSSAAHLKAAALPRQSSHVILPFPKMKETEVYAPNYRDGERVVLIRYPHGGIFEIPELVVNNKNPDARKLMPNAKDAIGINPKVAERLSGADFDGDTVLVIPNNNKSIKTAPPLKDLEGFDPKIAYKGYDGMKVITPKLKQTEMGNVSNLITDMTIKGANQREIARAVKHSMVVIDSEKHKLNYKQSYIDNGIAELKAKYQGSAKKGASTLISRASSSIRVGQFKESVDPTTGKRIFTPTNETYVNKQGKVLPRLAKLKRMDTVDDAYALSSGTEMETVYANHANSLKRMANEARKTAIETKPTPYSASAKITYANEVASLNAKLHIALKNAPLERQAQLLANSIVASKRAANPDMDSSDVKKLKGQALIEARARYGAKKVPVDITDREWEAIQAGAVSSNTLSNILNNSDPDRIKQLAMPRTVAAIDAGKQARAKAMSSAGRTTSEIADALGMSTTRITQLLD